VETEEVKSRIYASTRGEHSTSLTNELPYTEFFGLKVSIFTKDQLVQYIEEALTSDSPRVFFGYSIGSIARLDLQPEIYSYINDSELMVTDGRLFYLLAKLCGLPLKYDISIPYLTELTLHIARKNYSSVMIIGSTQKNNSKATMNLRKQYKGMTVYDGYHGGDFSDTEHAKLVSHINKHKPDILLIGVSSPKKEYFVFRNKSKLNVKIIIPCGGMVDVLSGESVRIPYVLKKLGFGGVWRTIQEPKRLLSYKLWQIYTISAKVGPSIMYHRFVKRNPSFFLPSIFNIPNLE